MSDWDVSGSGSGEGGDADLSVEWKSWINEDIFSAIHQNQSAETKSISSELIQSMKDYKMTELFCCTSWQVLDGFD